MSGLSKELLQDSEVTLRLADDLVAELSEDGVGEDGAARLSLDGTDHGAGVEGLLVRMYGELQRILYSVRKSRGLLEEAALSHLENTNSKLREVSSTTEFAATNMLDGVDRALGLVDRVEADGSDEEAFAALRDELHSLVVALQFQDITSQQLEHASAIIEGLEGQLRRVAKMFAITVLHEAEEDEDVELPGVVGAFDPAASVEDANTRQALADDIFK